MVSIDIKLLLRIRFDFGVDGGIRGRRALLEKPLCDPHWLEEILAFDENLINGFERQPFGLWEEEVNAWQDQAEIDDGPDNVESGKQRQ